MNAVRAKVQQQQTQQQDSEAPKGFTTFPEFITYLASRKCPKCSTALIQSPRDIMGLFESWLSGKAQPSSLLTCRKCSATTCIACSSQAPKPLNIEGMQVSWCCSRGRLFLLWVFLCAFDEQFCTAKLAEAATKGKGVSRSSRSNGVGYGGGGVSLTDMYFGRQGQGRAEMAQAQEKRKAQSAEQKTDEFNGQILLFVEQLIPSLDRQSKFDKEPPAVVADILLNSKILSYSAELLRNDSLEDAARRKPLYDVFFRFLRIIGQHPVTANQTVYNERPVRPDTVNLLTISFQNASGKEEAATPLADLLRNLNVQSTIMLNGATKNQKDFQNEEGQQLLWLCRVIYDTSQWLLDKTPGGCGTGTGGLGNAPKEYGIVEVPDDHIFRTHCFAREASHMPNPAPGRIKRLITELTSLTTGLPPGIFVKYASSRLDMMKFVIVGPSGTPYENGLFEFDLFCPANYPFVSPKCWFRGARRGITFNPNLHADGKVCLSLLGTWEGEPWRPGESTILQVMISIQAMILCEEPFCNEPSFGSARGTRESKMYNKRCQSLTIQYAMLNWLTSPPPLWQDVVNLHFKKSASQILQTVERWAKQGDTGSNSFRFDPVSPVASFKPQLQATLQPYIRSSKQSTGNVAQQAQSGASSGSSSKFGFGRRH
ncbi:hypothetical protein BDV95DRAFT_647791 [Massariosphaeria phaeospora]|uniref:UBC core domain-containing protein n=1 Tax=Massariosphaeria phaeospora TaxID=100035 RepID=A0A7C8I257_9PLEO|nr:hypothetical protein BDV95DRAFT_647791 [Massariosphaeria phaeospora]